MLNVLDATTNKVYGFEDETTPLDTIKSVIDANNNGAISEAKPNWYRDKIQPVLQKTGMDMFQPKFIGGTTAEPDAHRAFFGSAVKDLSFGLIDPIKNSPVMQESVDEHPVISFTGSLVGQTAAVFATAGLSKAIGWTGEIPVLGKMGNAVVNNFKIGALYGAINSGVGEFNKSIDDNASPDLIKVGVDALKTGGVFSLYGGTGAAFKSIPVATAVVSGMAYTISKMEGASEQDALLNAGVMGAFHLVSSTNEKDHPPQKFIEFGNMDGLGDVGKLYGEPGVIKRPEIFVSTSQKEWPVIPKKLTPQEQDVQDKVVAYDIKDVHDSVVAGVNKMKAGYIKSQAPQVHDAIAERTAQEHTMNMEDEIASSAMVSEGGPVAPTTKEILSKHVQDMLGVKEEKPLTPEVNKNPDGKVTKVSDDINSKIVTKGFDELTKEQQAVFDPITKEDQLKKVSELLTKDPEKAKSMALGKEPIPNDLNSQVVFNAVKLKALDDLDINTLRELASSPIATERSVAAQTLSASGFNNGESDPIVAIQEIAKTRQAANNKKTGKGNVEKQKKEEVSKIQKSIKEVVKKQDWEGFIKGLEC